MDFELKSVYIENVDMLSALIYPKHIEMFSILIFVIICWVKYIVILICCTRWVSWCVEYVDIFYMLNYSLCLYVHYDEVFTMLIFSLCLHVQSVNTFIMLICSESLYVFILVTDFLFETGIVNGAQELTGTSGFRVINNIVFKF